jgi:hypothetical protein
MARRTERTFELATMRDLIRDWNRWTAAERVTAVALTFGIVGTVCSAMLRTLV